MSSASQRNFLSKMNPRTHEIIFHPIQIYEIGKRDLVFVKGDEIFNNLDFFHALSMTQSYKADYRAII